MRDRMTHLPVNWSADTLTVGLTGRLTSGLNDWLMSHWPTNCCPATEHRIMSVCLRKPQLCFILGAGNKLVWVLWVWMNSSAFQRFESAVIKRCLSCLVVNVHFNSGQSLCGNFCMKTGWKCLPRRWWLDKLPDQQRGNACIVVCLLSFSSLCLCLPRADEKKPICPTYLAQFCIHRHRKLSFCKRFIQNLSPVIFRY